MPKARPRRLAAIFRLAALVFTDIVRSNIAVARIILGLERRQWSSGFVEIPLELRDPYGLAALACIITSTPGTLWVDFNEASGTLTIHVLDLVDKSEWVRTIKGRYERLLLEIFRMSAIIACVSHCGTDPVGLCNGVRHVPHPLGSTGPRPGRRFRQPVCERDAASSRLWRRVREFALLRGSSDSCAARVREHGSACEIPASWRGDRMNDGMEIPVLSGLLTAMLLVGGAAITLTGSLGLLRLRGFYERVHAPTLGTTLGTTCVALASIIYFSSLREPSRFS